MNKLVRISGLARLFGSTARAEIFRILFGLEAKEIHMREIERQSGLAIGTIQQDLRTLEKLGLVRTRRDGNRLYYRADRDHPLYHEIRNLVLKTVGLVDLFAKQLGGDEIQVAFVYGSIARGEESATSDIDIMVIGSLGIRKLTHLLSGVSKKIGREINPFVMSQKDFMAKKRAGDHFLKEVLESPKIFIKGNEHDLETMGD